MQAFLASTRKARGFISYDCSTGWLSSHVSLLEGILRQDVVSSLNFKSAFVRSRRSAKTLEQIYVEFSGKTLIGYSSEVVNALRAACISTEADYFVLADR